MFKLNSLTKLKETTKYNRRFHIFIISIFIFLTYINILGNNFVLDDFQFFNWPEAKSFNISAILQGAYPNEHEIKYRPIKGLIIATEYQIWKNDVFFYHLQSILIHLAIVLIIYSLVLLIAKSPPFAFLVSLLFGVHPIHTEMITFMSSSIDAFGVLFFFLSFYFYIKIAEEKKKKFYLISLLFAFLAFFTYEITFSLFVLIIFYDIVFKKINKKNLLGKIGIYSSYLLLILLFFVIRTFFIGKLQTSPYFADSFYLTFLTMIKAFVKYLEIFAFPLNLTINPVLMGGIEAYINSFYDFEPIKMQSILNPSIIFSIFIIFLLVFLFFYFLKREKIISFAIGWVFLGLAPVSNLLFPLNTIIAERYFYVSSLGTVILMTYFLTYVYRKGYKKIFMISLFIILTFYSFLTILRNADWKDEKTFFTSLSLQKQGSGEGDYYLAKYYSTRNDTNKSIYYFEKLIKTRKYYPEDTYLYLALAYSRSSKYDMVKYTFSRLELYKKNSQKNFNDLKNRSITYAQLQSKRQSITLSDFNFENVFLFSYPSLWNVQKNSNVIKLRSEKGDFSVEVTYSKLTKNISIKEHLANQFKTYGKLINQGVAKIPSVDYAYVKAWQDNDINKLQFFLFKDANVLEILVFPTDSDNMNKFNNIVNSLKFTK